LDSLPVRCTEKGHGLDTAVPLDSGANLAYQKYRQSRRSLCAMTLGTGLAEKSSRYQQFADPTCIRWSWFCQSHLDQPTRGWNRFSRSSQRSSAPHSVRKTCLVRAQKRLLHLSFSSFTQSTSNHCSLIR